ncbi:MULTISPECIES: hypothetical protein [Aeromonas]|nr:MULTISPECIES: hypothetical protein [Aeromonas]KRW51019.1 hypothetical protein AO736_18625 [Aeromonas veronii]WOX54130.1 hypothetical protein R2E40_08425 [Aeromonas sp. CD]
MRNPSLPDDDPSVTTLVIVANLVARVRLGEISAEEAVHELFDLGFRNAPLSAFMNLFAFDDSVMETIFMSYEPASSSW